MPSIWCVLPKLFSLVWMLLLLISAPDRLLILCVGVRLESLGYVIHMLIATAEQNQILFMLLSFVVKWLNAGKF